MLTAYRRHSDDCPDRKKGQNYSLCGCPIWCYGKIDGKSVRQSLRTTDPVKAANRMEMIERGEDLPADMSNSPTVTFGVKCFLTSCSERGLKASTLDSYRRTLSHLEEYCGNRLLASIDVRTLDAYRSNRVVKPVLKKGVMQAPRNIASGTWRKELETIRDFFSWAFDRKWMAERPASKLKMPRTEELVTAPFTAGEVHDVLDAVNDITTSNPAELTYVRQRARALVYVLLYSGLRISDVAALERSQLNGQHLTLRILKNGVRLKVLLHKNAVNSLASLPSANPRYFFWSGTGNIITCITNLRRTIYRLGQMAGVHAHPHRFRDTFAVELLTNGADIRTVQKLLGHKSIRTTEKHYAHFVAAHQALLDSAAATLDFERPVGRRPALVKPLNNRRRYA